MVNAKSSLKFKNYVVDSIDFKSNLDYSGTETELDFDIDSECKFEEDTFILRLEISIFKDAKQNNYPFSMRVSLLGLFEFDSDLNIETRTVFAEQNAIAILFPYLRAMISVYSSNANIGTILLPPINVVKYLENKRKNRS